MPPKATNPALKVVFGHEPLTNELLLARCVGSVGYRGPGLLPSVVAGTNPPLAMTYQLRRSDLIICDLCCTQVLSTCAEDGMQYSTKREKYERAEMCRRPLLLSLCSHERPCTAMHALLMKGIPTGGCCSIGCQKTACWCTCAC